ncbi:MAG: hypothetical protein KVP17_002495 [Porospora cf. gigantea B]|uniref:uncharacterized protein n=1 Tax=Porospora cf. gigantea B TaxID=2853592 RepID=UPI00357192E4|nr:MAG: hypothetical protein KVP17_002495 [Porospora cf. gigantea B]
MSSYDSDSSEEELIRRQSKRLGLDLPPKPAKKQALTNEEPKNETPANKTESKLPPPLVALASAEVTFLQKAHELAIAKPQRVKVMEALSKTLPPIKTDQADREEAKRFKMPSTDWHVPLTALDVLKGQEPKKGES